MRWTEVKSKLVNGSGSIDSCSRILQTCGNCPVFCFIDDCNFSKPSSRTRRNCWNSVLINVGVIRSGDSRGPFPHRNPADSNLDHNNLMHFLQSMLSPVSIKILHNRDPRFCCDQCRWDGGSRQLPTQTRIDASPNYVSGRCLTSTKINANILVSKNTQLYTGQM